MPFEATCERCLSLLKVPNKLRLRGKPIPCPKCAFPLKLPAAESTARPDGAGSSGMIVFDAEPPTSPVETKKPIRPATSARVVESSRPVSKQREDELREEWEEDVRRRRKTSKSTRSQKPGNGLLIGIIAGTVSLLILGFVGAIFVVQAVLTESKKSVSTLPSGSQNQTAISTSPISLTPGKTPDSPWVEISMPKFGVTLSAPSAMRSRPVPSVSPNVTAEVRDVTVEGLEYVITAIQLPAGTPDQEIKLRKEVGVDGFLRRVNGKITETKTVSMAGLEFQQIISTNSAGFSVMRTGSRGERIFMFAVGSFSPVSESTPQVERFFRSIRIDAIPDGAK